MAIAYSTKSERKQRLHHGMDSTPVSGKRRSTFAILSNRTTNHTKEMNPVEALAKRARMSPRNFSRVCLREMRMSPGQFVDRVRVEAAQQMIDSSSKGLKQIADECGFGTADSMRRAFQRVMQTTASEYAQRFKRPGEV